MPQSGAPSRGTSKNIGSVWIHFWVYWGRWMRLWNGSPFKAWLWKSDLAPGEERRERKKEGFVPFLLQLKLFLCNLDFTIFSVINSPMTFHSGHRDSFRSSNLLLWRSRLFLFFSFFFFLFSSLVCKCIHLRMFLAHNEISHRLSFSLFLNNTTFLSVND